MGTPFRSLRSRDDSPAPVRPGTIGILTSEQGRFSRFWLSLLGLNLPASTKLIVKMSLNIAEARNEILRDAEGDWVWFMDDDHTFDPGLLARLLARDVDIVQPVVLTRYSPFSPVHMGPPTADGTGHWRYALHESDPAGLREVHVVGCGGMLVRRRVWEALETPYFEMGTMAKDVLSEDISFCTRARACGFHVYVDLENAMGHLNEGEVTPERLPDGSWRTRLTFGQETILLPPAEPKKIILPTGEEHEYQRSTD